MAIVMLGLFEPGTVPGTGPGPFPARDILNLREAFTAAIDIIYRCVQRTRQLGWSENGNILILLNFYFSTIV